MPPRRPSRSVNCLLSRLAALGLGLAVGLGEPAGAAEPPSEEPAVARLLEEHRIIDQETLLLLAQEQGIGAAEARKALAGLLRRGGARSEPGPGDEVTISWVDGPARSPGNGGSA